MESMTEMMAKLAFYRENFGDVPVPKVLIPVRSPTRNHD